MQNNVVAHLLDGRMLKGTTLDVDPNRPTCHIRPVDGKAELIKLSDIKALFFVRSLTGNPEYNDATETQSYDPRLRGSFPITVKFRDNECIVGLTNRYPPNKTFFFIVPVDQNSNNIRILVNRDAIVSMEATGKAPV